MDWIRALLSASTQVCSPIRALCNSPCVTSSSAGHNLDDEKGGGNSAPSLFSARQRDRGSGIACLFQRRVAHAEARSYMLGEQLNRGTVGDRIGLCQIFHGFDQAALAIYVAGIRSAFSSFATELRDYWNSKNFGHRKFTRPLLSAAFKNSVYLPAPQFSALILAIFGF